MERTMKAARLHGINKPLTIDTVPIPLIGPDDVLLRVKTCGICGSDLHMLDGSTKVASFPTILGHEFAGIIAELGERVEGWKAGERVCAYFMITCGRCVYCLSGRESLCLTRKRLGSDLDGGYAEYVKVPAKNLIRLPANIPFGIGAIITDAVATPFHAITKRSNLKPGETVAVFGVGGLGTHAIQLLKLAGAGEIIAVDIHDQVLERARMLGADSTINACLSDPVTEIRNLTGGLGTHLSLELIGHNKTVHQAVDCLRPGGRAVIIGLSTEDINVVNPGIFARAEYEMVGSFAFERTEIEQLLDLVAKGKLDLSRSITKIIAIDEINKGLHELEHKVGNPIRIVVGME